MKLTILVVLTALLIFIAGFENPALFFMGYIWTSVLYPSAFADSSIPLSMIFGAASLIGYFFVDKTNKGPLPIVFYIAAVFAGWITFTTLTAEVSNTAWLKWDWAIQSIIITIASPLLLRTRTQIEAAFIVTLTAIAAHVMTAGVKTIFGTGGYDRLGRLMMTNFWLGETSTLALAAIITLPMAYYAASRSIIFEPYRGRLVQACLLVYIGLAIMCMIGTSARTGVIAFGVLLLFGIKGYVRKALLILTAAGVFFVAQPYLPGKSLGRFGTIGTYQQDESALTRLAVWHWALGYAAEHPLGGGFGIFYTNAFDFQMQNEQGQPVIEHQTGVAPHSIYFEVLGEHGYPGEILYLCLLGGGLWGTYRISRVRRSEAGGKEREWYQDFARALFICILLYAVGASFVGIAFQPLFYLFLGLYCSVYRLVPRERTRSEKYLAKPDAYVAALR